MLGYSQNHLAVAGGCAAFSSFKKGHLDMNRVTVAVLGTFVVILIASGILTYFLREPAQPTAAPAATASPSPGTQSIPLLGQLFGPDATGLTPATVSSWE